MFNPNLRKALATTGALAALGTFAVAGERATDLNPGSHAPEYTSEPSPNPNGFLTSAPDSELAPGANEIQHRIASNNVQNAGIPETPASVTAAESAAAATSTPSGPSQEDLQSSANMTGELPPAVQ